MHVEPQEEHRWLQKLVGEWSWEFDHEGPDGAPIHWTGTESVRSIGGVWVMMESVGHGPGGAPSTTIMTLGYDPARGKYVGSFIGSMMANLWVYEGTRNGDRLELETEGPAFSGEGGTQKYVDTVELLSDDEHTLVSRVQEADGSWKQVMSLTYRRVA